MQILGFEISVQRDESRSGKWTRRALVLLAANGVVLGTGSAFAFWSASGSSSGTASTGTASALTVSVTGLTGLYPTQKTTVPVSVTNTNPFGVTLSSIVLTSVTPTGSGCNAGDITLDSSASGVTGNSFAVSNSLTKSTGASPTANLNVPIAVANLADTCQGAGHSFSLTFTANATSS